MFPNKFDENDAGGIDYGSLNIYLRLTQFVRTMLISIGFNFFNPNYKLNTLTILMYLIIFSFFSCVAYSVYMEHDNFYEILKFLAFIGIPTKGFISCCTIQFFAVELHEMHTEIVQVHRRARGSHSRKLYTWMWWTERLIRVQMGLYILSGIILITCPLVYYLVYGEKILMINVMIPGLDAKENIGYLLITLYELYCIYLSVVILSTADSIFIVMVFSGGAYLDLSSGMCEHFSANLNANTSNSSQSIRDRKKALAMKRRLISTVQSTTVANRFISKLCTIYNFGCLIQMNGAGITLGICILIGKFKLIPWVVAFQMGISCLYNILICSFIGTVLEIMSLNLERDIYYINWFWMPILDRKTLLIMLQYAQRTAGIQMIGSQCLNVEYGLDILKTIYSGYMMLDGMQ